MEFRKTLEIISNYLPEQTFKNIKDIFFKNNFPWFYVDYVSTETDKSDFLFYHFLYKDEKVCSPFFEEIVPTLTNKKIYRAKCNLYTKKDKEIHSEFHVDLPHPHKVLLYSINTNNGFTLFENGDKVPSKENQAILFDGKIRHKSVAQTDERVRININIDYEF